MALFWNKELKHLQVAAELAGIANPNLTLVQNGNIDRTSEIPKCNPIYIKHVNGFPVEMDEDEKIQADAAFLLKEKEYYVSLVKEEAERRIIEENKGLNSGIGFLGLKEHTQRNYLALCLNMVKKSMDIIYGSDILSVLDEKDRATYNSIYSAWGTIMAIRNIEGQISKEIMDASSISSISEILIETNPKWIT